MENLSLFSQMPLKKYWITLQRDACLADLKHVLFFPENNKNALDQLKSKFKQKEALTWYYDSMYQAGDFLVGVQRQKNREGKPIINSESYTVLDWTGLELKKMRGPFSKVNPHDIYFEIYESEEKNEEGVQKLAYYDQELQLIIEGLNWDVGLVATDSEGLLFFSPQTQQRAFLTFWQHRELQWVWEEDAAQEKWYQKYQLRS